MREFLGLFEIVLIAQWCVEGNPSLNQAWSGGPLAQSSHGAFVERRHRSNDVRNDIDFYKKQDYRAGTLSLSNG